MAMSQEEFMREDTQKGRFLTFSLGKEVFGVEIKFVSEIIGIQPITQIPEAPDYIRGIVNLRGKIIPVMDMRLKFGMEKIAYDDRTCIIVIDTDDITIGLIVDKVAEVLMIDEENISPPPDVRTGLQNRYISGIGKVGNDVKLLLSCEELFLVEKLIEKKAV